jgi:Tfp pilus assembly protein PilO
MNLQALDSIRAELRPESSVALAGAVLGLLLLAGWLYALGPAVASHGEISEQYRQTVGAGLAADAEPHVQQELLAKAEASVASLRDQLYGEAANIPERERQAHVIEALNRAAERRAVGLAMVTPGSPTDVLMFKELPYDVRVEGPFFQLYDWLQDVELELRPMIVKQFRLRPLADGGEVAMELRLVAYRAREDIR